MKTCFLFLVSCFLFLSCSKDDLEGRKLESAIEVDLSQKELAFIHSLRDGVSKVKVYQKTQDPNNSNNPFDFLGQNIRALLIDVNQLELLSPSSNMEEYRAKWLSIFAEHANGMELPIIEDNLSLESRALLAQLIGTTVDFSNPSLSIEQMKFLENEIAESDIIGLATRQYLLGFSSMMRHFVWEIHNQGIVMSGANYTPSILQGAWYDCFDHYFEQAAPQNFGVLTSWDSPVQTAIAWYSLPLTLVGALADSIYQGVSNSVNDPDC